MRRHTLLVGCVLLTAATSRATPPDPKALAERIDARLDTRLKAANAIAAPPADDAEFLRRAYLDLTGRITAPRDVHDFLADTDPHKRARLVDDLLDSPRYATHFAAVWRALLLPEAAANLEARVFQPGFEEWLRLKLRANAPYDQVVRELLTTSMASDPQAPEPVLRDPARPNPLAFFAVKEAKPENLAAATARVFLGVRIECAQCHDHPFGRWERKQFWNLAAFFAGVSRQGDGLFAPISDTGRHELTMPNTGKTVQATFFNGKSLDKSADHNPRAELAKWLTSRDNPYFARAGANRVWGHFFGIGIVDPVDDFNDQNKPSHPELLDDLAAAFAAADFDPKYLIRAICNTRAYRRTSARTDPTQDDPRLFARMAVKGLTAEQFFDSLAFATGYREPAGRGRNAVQAQFLAEFAPQGKPTEPETSITRALTLMNGRFLNRVTSPQDGPTLTAACETPGLDTAGRVEVLYVAALSRKPSDKERQRMVRYVEAVGPERRAERLADVFWVLLNSAEFRLNH
jgi:hypothetical protein